MSSFKKITHRIPDSNHGDDPLNLGSLSRFQHAGSTRERLKYAGEIGLRSSPGALWLSSQAYLETAVKDNKGSERQSEAFARAKYQASKGLDLAKHLPENAPYVKFGLINTLGAIPLYANIFYLGQMPSVELLNKYYESVLEQIGQLIDVLSSRELTNEEKQKVGGILGEIVATGMLNRYGLVQIGDNSFIALPALLTEDRGAKKSGIHTNSRNLWDVSVYTDVDLDGDIDLSYKVQVKADGSPDLVYSPDIVVVKPNYFILDDNKHIGGWQQIGRELRGAETHSTAAEVVDARVDLLVDILNGDI